MDFRASRRVRLAVSTPVYAAAGMLLFLRADLAIQNTVGYVDQTIQQQYLSGSQVWLHRCNTRGLLRKIPVKHVAGDGPICLVVANAKDTAFEEICRFRPKSRLLVRWARFAVPTDPVRTDRVSPEIRGCKLRNGQSCRGVTDWLAHS
jgi:hypothetical protein